MSGPLLRLAGREFMRDSTTNVTSAIADKVGRGLLHQRNHPLRIIKNEIEKYFHQDKFRVRGRPVFASFDNVFPVVTTQQNFDSLLFPKDHVARAVSDNYYVNKSLMLRAHTSAHQADFIGQGLDAFLIAGDVYRRDEIDRSHYPVFHQMEGVRLFSTADLAEKIGEHPWRAETARNPLAQETHAEAAAAYVAKDLKTSLEGLAAHLFGPVEMRWIDTYFPFTHPSFELEIMFEGNWLEVLGCGVMEQKILSHAGVTDKMGWAFGLGLERLAMVLFGIPDIRLFWSSDDRFLSQFSEENALKTRFQPFSKYPACYKDISFWLPEGYSQNSFSDLVRNTAGDLAEEVKLIDEFVHPKTKRASHCYRILYRSMDRTVTNEEINVIQDTLREHVKTELGVELR